jgi:hypothetical protein
MSAGWLRLTDDGGRKTKPLLDRTQLDEPGVVTTGPTGSRKLQAVSDER